MCGRGATSACAASGRTNGGNAHRCNLPFTSPPHRVGGARLRQCSSGSLARRAAAKPISADAAARQRARRRDGPWRLGSRGWELGIGARRCSSGPPPPARFDHVPTARLRLRRTTGVSYGERRHMLREGLGVPRAAAAGAGPGRHAPGSSPRLPARAASRRRRRRASPARCSTAAAFQRRGAARAAAIFAQSSVSGCAPPNTRRAIRAASSSVATASRRSSRRAACAPPPDLSRSSPSDPRNRFGPAPCPSTTVARVVASVSLEPILPRLISSAAIAAADRAPNRRFLVGAVLR